MDLSNYIDVPTRFAALLAKWPELRIKEHRPEIITVGDQIFISVTMQAWRTPDDPLPCQATCYEPFPGRTPFTKLAEQQNASTSCLGRLAGLMMSFPKMASLEEVINRQTEEKPKSFIADKPSEAQLRLLKALGHTDTPPATKREASALIEALKEAQVNANGEAF
jgi:hypothetical protein